MASRASKKIDDLVTKGVCSLSAEELDERIAMIRAEIQPHLIASVAVPGGVAWEFEGDEPMRVRIEKVAELERACCGGGLDFQVAAPPLPEHSADHNNPTFLLCGEPDISKVG
jgi:hypothetical protein